MFKIFKFLKRGRKAPKSFREKIAMLQDKKEDALDAFLKTKRSLEDVNDELVETLADAVSEMEELAFAKEQLEAEKKANDKIIDNIKKVIE